MAGDILMSKEFTEIRKDLTMKYIFKSKVAYERYRDDTILIDTVCTYYKKDGKISRNGMINFEKRIEKSCK